MTQPDSTLAVGPEPSDRGMGSPSSRRLTGGVAARWAAGARRSSRSARATPIIQPAPITRCRCGSTPARPRRLTPRVETARVGSAWARAASIMRPNGTPLGQAASQARHARHSSIIVVNEASTVGLALLHRPHGGDAAARARPSRGPVRRKVGQCGRQSPHATHLTTSSSAGAGSEGSQFEVSPTAPSPG